MRIELSEFNIKIFIPLIYPIFYRIDFRIRTTFFTDENELFKGFRYFMGHSLNFIPYLIIKYRTRKKRKNNEQQNENKEEKENDNELGKLMKKISRKTKIKKALFLFLLSCISYVVILYRHLFLKENYLIMKQSMGTFFEISVFIALSYFVLNQKLHKHHFIFSGIIAFILMILFVVSLFYMDTSDIFWSLLYYFFFSLFFGSLDVLGKKYMINYFATPYFLMTFIGIIGVFLLLISDFFIYILDIDEKGTIIGIKDNITNISLIFILILDIIIQWAWITGIWLTIYYFTPCHYFISEYISEYIYYIMNAIDKKEDFYSNINIIIFSISFFINFCCCLIFNEVIILNFCKLDYNTRKRIQERSSLENQNNSLYGNMIEPDENSEEEL